MDHRQIKNLPEYEDKTVIAVRAPTGTTLEVPDPDDGKPEGRKRYQMFLRSVNGPIDVYLISSLPDDGQVPSRLLSLVDAMGVTFWFRRAGQRHEPVEAATGFQGERREAGLQRG